MRMFPHHYACTSCREQFRFAHREAWYAFDADAASLGRRLTAAELFEVPVRPAWCKACAAVCIVEDIAPTRAFEEAYGAARAGRAVDYPTATAGVDASSARDEIAAYLRWRMGRRHAPRALCCGGTDYQFLDVAQPLFKHAECDFGVVEPAYFFPGSHNGPGPGVYSAANLRVHDSEGNLIGLLTWRERGSDTWDVVPAAYPATDED